MDNTVIHEVYSSVKQAFFTVIAGNFEDNTFCFFDDFTEASKINPLKF